MKLVFNITIRSKEQSKSDKQEKKYFIGPKPTVALICVVLWHVVWCHNQLCAVIKSSFHIHYWVTKIAESGQSRRNKVMLCHMIIIFQILSLCKKC